MPIYFHALAGVGPFELLAHRVVWSAVLLAGLITLFGRWKQVYSCLAEPKTRWLMVGCTVLIAVNWGVFIYGVSVNEVVQNSLGYFINPLLNVLIGVVFFGERPRRVQGFALLLAGGGVCFLVAGGGGFPRVGVALALLFPPHRAPRQ